ncbi:hypothetical protein Ddc_15528 [Ditylenchus destructor]|nr:hypothetical protein Ddc_15528 [Ditylenchus destructor]
MKYLNIWKQELYQRKKLSTEFPLQRKSHAIIDLKLHLENEQQIYWNKKKDTAEKIKKKKEQDTQLTAFFKLCRESVHSEFAKKFRYWEIVEHFTWHEQQKCGNRLKLEMYEIYPSQVELSLSKARFDYR